MIRHLSSFLLLLASPLGLASGDVKPEGSEKYTYQGIVYDRTYMDELTDDYVWNKRQYEHDKFGPEGNPSKVRHIDAGFFDEFIVHRWTSQWLAGDTTWVLALGKNVPWFEDY